MGQDVSNLEELEELLQDNVVGEFIIRLLEFYGSFGIIPGFAFPFIEAFLSFLPVIVFIMANSIVYGLELGFLLSWAGASAGAIVFFIIIRKMIRFRWVRKIQHQKQVRRVTAWFDRHGFGPLFLLLCFPFSPSALINIVAAFSKIPLKQFMLAVLLGKAVMVFSVSYVGESLASFAQNPTKTIVVGICIGLFWMVGKYVEKRIQSNAEQGEHPNNKG
ncbi:TVP38/TMEM64 family protein [Halalkalibacillus sediminis]|uniref:TVP38/TMEM64 family membrane protein n=1 Tax=Halalkalibacillus sediminis TaxID=2018042 RepID=A0A2I0QVE5_9BACI|nr:TVP38/TMEM64 family protein [Halalkalibacillus sediminis]PKR78306.1 TVP38/TMEM64 family protein [Halalkalibacillus sediminis]